MMKKLIYFISAVCLCLFLAACANNVDNPDALYKGQAESKIYDDGVTLMKKADYSEAAKHFETLDVRYPFGKYSRQAKLNSIYCYYKQEDFPSALAMADRYIQLYPQGPDVDYAYYMRGLVGLSENHSLFEKYLPADLAKRDLAPLTQSFRDFNQLLRYYPKSKYAADARQHMIYIRNLFGRHALEIAQFYFERKAYVAAADRANEVVQKYQETPSVPDALIIMVKSYRALGLTKQANDALAVLQLNFPEKARDI